jgi:signal transduction histidine kinase/HAMP domain-containing protein
LAKAASASYERVVDATRQLLMTLARLPIVRASDPRACTDRLGELLKLYPLYSNLGASTPDGNVFCSGLGIAKPINISDRSYFQRAQQYRGFSVGEYQIGRRTGKPTLNFGYPVLDESGTVESVVFAALDLASLKRIAAAGQLPTNSLLTVADERGTILSGVPDPGGWLGRTIPEAEIVGIALAKTEGVAAAIGLDGIKRFYGFTTVMLSPLKGRIHVIVGIPTDAALANARRNLARNLAGLLVVALFSLAVAWWGGEKLLLRPVNALLRATDRLSAGDLGARTGLAHSENEVGRLAASFDKMADSLESRRAEILNAQDRIQQNLDRMRALHEIDLAISSTLDLRAMLNLLLEKIDLVLPNSCTTIRLINKRTGQLEATACRNIDEETWLGRNPKPSRGVTKMILENKIPLTVANIQTDPRKLAPEMAHRLGLVSFLGVPIIAKDEVLGLIAFFTREEHSFKDEEIEFLATLAARVGIAIQNSRLYAEARQREAELSALHAITVTANESLDLTLVLKEAIRKITEIFHFDATRLFLFNAEMTELEIKSAFEAKPELWFQVKRFRRGESVVGHVAETGERIIFEDIAKDPRYPTLSTSKSSQNAGTRFLAMLPIKTKLRTWGVMSCVGTEPRQFKPEEISLLEAMNNQIGIAVENATLYEQTATKARELSALYSIAGVASESLEIDLLLQKTMEKVLEIFGFDAARIYLCQEGTKELNLVFYAGFPADVFPVDKYRIGEGLVGKTYEAGEPRIIENLQTDPGYIKYAKHRAMFKAGFRASILIPIKVRGENLGVMNFHSKKPHHFSESDLQLINAIAYHMGIAVGNANLFSQVKEKTIELEKANKGKDEFLGVISHELRTPLNVIKGYTEIMLGEILGEINAEQKKALGTISNQSMELFTMINGILQVTRIEAGAVQAATCEVNLCDLLGELRSNYSFPYGKELTLVWDYPASLPVVRTDDEKLKAVLQNLINNAIKFTEKGTVTVSTQQVPGAEMIEFKIADTGIGIPQDKLQTVFDMFQQVDSSATRKFSGVGLGLYIVKKFTELLGGGVRVESEMDKGSVFTVTLPLSYAAPSQEAQDSPLVANTTPWH